MNKLNNFYESDMKKKSIYKLLVIAISLLILPGCSTMKPWVKAYERQNLADPIMAANRHAISSAYLHHVYEAREGSRGAVGSGGGGCGCN